MKKRCRLFFKVAATYLTITSLIGAIPIDGGPQRPAPSTEQKGSRSTDANREIEAGREARSPDSKLRVAASPEEKAAALKRKRELAMSLLEGVLASANRITPVEYSLLASVEAATLLWEYDRDRSLAVLKKDWDRLNELLEEQKKMNGDRATRKQQRLRFSVLRRIAKLNPDLLKHLGSTNEEARTVLPKWTDEARAIMSVAEEQLESNPGISLELARRSLAFGLVDWVPFLTKMSASDNAQAEQAAAMLMNRFSSASVSPFELLHLDRFALDPARTPEFKGQFFQALLSRLAQDLRPDSPTTTLRVSMQAAQEALNMASGPIWPGRFQELVAQYESQLASRSATPSSPPRRVAVDTSMLTPAKAGDTSETEQASQRVEKINDPISRDKEYQKLAASAAARDNRSLAEELMSRIDNEEIRREATIGVYGPSIRQYLSEGNWTKAQTDASKITHALGRTLILDIIAQMIMRSGKGKRDEALDVYEAAVSSLQREGATENAAKGFLIIAKSLLAIDQERSLDAINWAVFVLNKIAKGGDLLADPESSGALASWVSLPIRTLRYDEVLELSEMIGPLFKEITKRDLDRAVSTANDLAHLGLNSLAQLGIVSELQKELRGSKTGVPDVSTKKKSR